MCRIIVRVNKKNATTMTSRIQPRSLPHLLPHLAAAHDKTVGAAATRHYAEYAMEAAGLGIFMVSACVFTALLFHPLSSVAQAVPSLALRRMLMGIAMGCTAYALITSPWGERSGAHLNPAVTLTFFRLGKVEACDAIFYVLAQFIGGTLGVLLVRVVLGSAVAHRSVHYAVTAPGKHGVVVAFASEIVITFVLMTVVLLSTNSRRFTRLTPMFVAVLVALYIAFESPLSGMSMNPARSTASAVGAHYFTSLWIYFTAPVIGMMAAAELFLRFRQGVAPICAKLHHANPQPCIFRCGHRQHMAEAANAKSN